ncbi:predicted protein [Chaetoceros tenuissimus]|uniref:Uncharacterized protein n=1 Tax=Chaetoceros tenuissimus TaxID=426638 RepID=A0AAD3CIM8_9STRA|nr:predicted protein [Chaetoceros tenuissimus]
MATNEPLHSYRSSKYNREYERRASSPTPNSSRRVTRSPSPTRFRNDYSRSQHPITPSPNNDRYAQSDIGQPSSNLNFGENLNQTKDDLQIEKKENKLNVKELAMRLNGNSKSSYRPPWLKQKQKSMEKKEETSKEQLMDVPVHDEPIWSPRTTATALHKSIAAVSPDKSPIESSPSSSSLEKDASDPIELKKAKTVQNAGIDSDSNERGVLGKAQFWRNQTMRKRSCSPKRDRLSGEDSKLSHSSRGRNVDTSITRERSRSIRKAYDIQRRISKSPIRKTRENIDKEENEAKKNEISIVSTPSRVKEIQERFGGTPSSKTDNRTFENENKDDLESEVKKKVITSERGRVDKSLLPSRERSRSIRKAYERQQRLSKSPVRSRDVVGDIKSNEKKENERTATVNESVDVSESVILSPTRIRLKAIQERFGGSVERAPKTVSNNSKTLDHDVKEVNDDQSGVVSMASQESSGSHKIETPIGQKSSPFKSRIAQFSTGYAISETPSRGFHVSSQIRAPRSQDETRSSEKVSEHVESKREESISRNIESNIIEKRVAEDRSRENTGVFSETGVKTFIKQSVASENFLNERNESNGSRTNFVQKAKYWGNNKTELVDPNKTSVANSKSDETSSPSFRPKIDERAQSSSIKGESQKSSESQAYADMDNQDQGRAIGKAVVDKVDNMNDYAQYLGRHRSNKKKEMPMIDDSMDVDEHENFSKLIKNTLQSSNCRKSGDGSLLSRNIDHQSTDEITGLQEKSYNQGCSNELRQKLVSRLPDIDLSPDRDKIEKLSPGPPKKDLNTNSNVSEQTLEETANLVSKTVKKMSVPLPLAADSNKYQDQKLVDFVTNARSQLRKVKKEDESASVEQNFKKDLDPVKLVESRDSKHVPVSPPKNNLVRTHDTVEEQEHEEERYHENETIVTDTSSFLSVQEVKKRLWDDGEKLKWQGHKKAEIPQPPKSAFRNKYYHAAEVAQKQSGCKSAMPTDFKEQRRGLETIGIQRSKPNDDEAMKKLIAKLSAVNQNDPDAALEAINSILDQHNQQNHFNAYSSKERNDDDDLHKVPPRRSSYNCGEYDDDDDDDDESTSSDEDSSYSDDSTVSSITNPTYMSGYMDMRKITSKHGNLHVGNLVHKQNPGKLSSRRPAPQSGNEFQMQQSKLAPRQPLAIRTSGRPQVEAPRDLQSHGQPKISQRIQHQAQHFESPTRKLKKHMERESPSKPLSAGGSSSHNRGLLHKFKNLGSDSDNEKEDFCHRHEQKFAQCLPESPSDRLKKLAKKIDDKSPACRSSSPKRFLYPPKQASAQRQREPSNRTAMSKEEDAAWGSGRYSEENYFVFDGNRSNQKPHLKAKNDVVFDPFEADNSRNNDFANQVLAEKFAMMEKSYRQR